MRTQANVEATDRWRRFPAALDGQVAAGAACWVLLVVFFAGQAVAQAASRAPYSLTGNYISELGSTACGPFTLATYHAQVCSPLHDVMNATFVVSGLLALLGAVLTRRAWPARRLSAAGLVLLGLGGVGQAVAGLRPENVDLGLHSLGAFFGIAGSNVGLLLLGCAVWRARRGFGTATVATGAVGLVGFVLTGAAPEAGFAVGTVERLAVYPMVLWMIGTGAVLLLTARRGSRLAA
jgi:hypothetical membrane protein